MKSFLIFVCLPLLVHCEPRDYFFVPTMTAYSRMLCASGVPGTQNPLVCPQNTLLSGPALFATPPMLSSLQGFPQTAARMSGPGLSQMASQNRNSKGQPYLIPIIPMSVPKRKQAEQLGSRSKKIYIIPWESAGEKPLVNYILVPDELLSPSAPLDTLDGNDERFEARPKKTRLTVTHHRRHKVPSGHSHHRSPHHRRQKRKHYDDVSIPKKNSKYVRAHESGSKHFRSVQTGGSLEDGNEYDDSANE